MEVRFLNTTDVEAKHLKKVVANDDLRPVMGGVYVDFKQSCLVATDAHVLVSYPIELTNVDTDLDGVVLPVKFFNRSYWVGDVPVKSKRLIEPEFVLKADCAEVYWLGEMVCRAKYIEGKYPEWSLLIPRTETSEPVEQCGLNVFFLKRLADAIPYSAGGLLKTTFFGPTKAIVFESHNSDFDGAIKAILMPAHLD